MSGKQPTIYDVAKAAGVSISTVSKVMNGTGSIGEKTKKKVEATMQTLDYQPIASSAVKKRIQTIGLLLPSIADPFSAEIARKIEDYGRNQGFSLIICSTDNDSKKEKAYIDMLKKKYVDGIIIATGLKSKAAQKELRDQQIPIILLSREVPSLALNSVLVNDFLGAYEATSHLISLGHRKIAMVTEDVYFSNIQSRLDGYKQALEDNGILYAEERVSTGNKSFNDAAKASSDLLEKDKDLTAIFASTEPLAIGAMQGVRQRGLQIPEDISIVGFDNSILAQMSYPPLTTIAQPIEEMAKKVIELFVASLENRDEVTQRIVLAPELTVRSSARKI
ncbi:transcriptional regulator DegA [Oceanobacillus oncorhynchi subsp. oncorhynchi]|uniref:LacI family DNA-binding transcriptional regulator n=1 Tax=Oceanobacillus oncorhynchi TaxID=545501 RepID=UPI0031D37688